MPQFNNSDVARLRKILAALSPKERDALERFYVLGQDTSQILREMKMAPDELRHLKAEVKRQFRMGGRSNSI